MIFSAIERVIGFAPPSAAWKRLRKSGSYGASERLLARCARYDLLTQLRRGLRGKLASYQVPVRNSLLNWEEARSHVLRLADRLGRELDRPFVIVIDGIDHAARASRYNQPAAREFFQSLPSPDALKNMAVRLLVAGQPSENYSEYPSWLAQDSSEVTPLTIGQLEEADVLLLLERNRPPFMPAQAAPAARLIVDTTTKPPSA